MQTMFMESQKQQAQLTATLFRKCQNTNRVQGYCVKQCFDKYFNAQCLHPLATNLELCCVINNLKNVYRGLETFGRCTSSLIFLCLHSGSLYTYLKRINMGSHDYRQKRLFVYFTRYHSRIFLTDTVCYKQIT